MHVVLHSPCAEFSPYLAPQRSFNILGKGESVTDGIELDANRWFEGFNKIIGRQQTERLNSIFRSR